MTQQLTGINTRIGTCPHGMPIGACPICNGSGGGGGSKTQEKTRMPGEMTWSQCFAEGMLLKQSKARMEANLNSPLHNVDLAQQLQRNISNYINNVQQIISAIKNSMPAPLAKAVEFLNQIILTPLLNIAAKIPKLVQAIQNFAENIRSTLQQVSEKLTAFFGEVKNFVNKKMSDFVKKATKKLFGFLGIQGMDEQEEIEAEDFFTVFSSKKD